MKRVLLVSYFFAPRASVGAARATKFYQQLPEFGWEPTVLTVRMGEPGAHDAEGDWPRVERTACWTLWANRVTSPPRRVGVSRGTAAPRWTLRQAAHRSRLWNHLYFALRHLLPLSSVRMPDATLGWIPYATKAGVELLRRGEFSAIWSTSGPPSCHLVARALHRASGFPWVADYRDPWSKNYADRRVWLFDQVEAAWERRVVSPARVVTTVSHGFARVQSALLRKPVEVIFNGYDDDIVLPQEGSEDRLTLRYTGTLYPEMRDVRPFLDALTEARRRRPQFDMRVEVIGPELRWLEALVAERGLSEMVVCRAPVPQREALRLQARASALLLFGWSREHQPGWLPVKLFEYMHSGRPILEIGETGTESAQILAECRAGVTSERTDEIADVLVAWHDEYRATGSIHSTTDRSAVARFSRRAQTKRLAEILDSL